jgi:hypothetical protein
MNDFFISYNKADKASAIAIRAWLIAAGYTVTAEISDFGVGSNFVLEMDRALKECKRVIMLLSPEYLSATYTHAEWAAAFARDPIGKDRILLPVMVKPCSPEGLLGQIAFISLVDLSLEEMEAELLSSIAASQTRRRSIGRRSRDVSQPSAPSSTTFNAVGQNTYQAVGDLILTQKHVTKAAPIVPQSHHISDGQAAKILELLRELGERDELAGKSSTYGRWQNRFKARPWAGPNSEGITSYKLLPAEEYDDAVTWLKSQKAIGRSSLRRPRNDEWRKELYGKIWGIARKMGWSDEDVHQFATTELALKKPLTSLTDLGERNLDKLAGIFYRKGRKRTSS